MTRILHFADAHIDIATHGRHDPHSGLPVRVLDFLKSLDTIVDTAIDEQVDLVLFAGDAYKDRTPVPTFQREWGRRMVRLSQAGIRTLLLVGNHDLSPASGRAHAMQEYETIPVAHVTVAARPTFYKPADLEDLPIQLIALPWVSRSSLMGTLELSGAEPGEVYAELELRLAQLVQLWLEQADPTLPVVMAAHASVQGAVYGAERSVMLGSDLVLQGSLVRDPRLSYVALGHIHKSQDVNHGAQPPVIYPGSIERVDFGEAHDDKFFVIADIQPGRDTQVDWRRLPGRRFIDRHVRLNGDLGPDTADSIQDRLLHALMPAEDLCEAMVRLVVEYPAEWEPLINEQAIRRFAEPCFEFHLVRRPLRDVRLRLPNDVAIASLTPIDLLDKYWGSLHVEDGETQALQAMAKQVIDSVSGVSDSDSAPSP
jgi:exonuclease SbcD